MKFLGKGDVMYFLIRGENNSWYTKKQGKNPLHFPSVELAIRSLQSYSGFNVPEAVIDSAIINVFSYDKNVIKFSAGDKTNEGKVLNIYSVDLKNENWGKHVDQGGQSNHN